MSRHSQRNTLLRLVHAGAKALFGDDEQTRRDWQEQRTGHRSCRDMTDQQLDALVKELRRQKALKPRKQSVNPQARKIHALWADMHRKGIVRDGSKKALGWFCHRMTGRYSPDWLTGEDAGRVIEGLKAIRDREQETQQ